jgi:hypothetical protein
MDSNDHDEREVRAARNQALFRAVNERLAELNDAFASATERFTIACECADVHCVGMIEIEPRKYLAVREEPRHFAVLREHIVPDVEDVVREHERYVVVEKRHAAGELSEALEEAMRAE